MSDLPKILAVKKKFCLAYERSGTSLHIEKLFRFRIGFSGEKKPANDYDLIRNGTTVGTIDSSTCDNHR